MIHKDRASLKLVLRIQNWSYRKLAPWLVDILNLGREMLAFHCVISTSGLAKPLESL